MENTEEDSYFELGAAMQAIQDADFLVLVHQKAAAYHQHAMEHAQESAEAARQLGATRRHLYRETIRKFSGIFAAASEAGGAHERDSQNLEEEEVVVVEEKPRVNRATLNSLVRMPAALQTGIFEPEGRVGCIAVHGRESSNLRVNEWRVQASAVNVAGEDNLSNSTVIVTIDSSQTGMTRDCPPYYASPLRPPFASPLQSLPRAPRSMAFVASGSNPSKAPAVGTNAIRITDVNGNPIHFERAPSRRMSTHSPPIMTVSPVAGAPPIPSMPTGHETQGVRSRAASQEGYGKLAVQIQHSDKEAERNREEREASGRAAKTHSHAGSDVFL